jgi:hypothetical protein
VVAVVITPLGLIAKSPDPDPLNVRLAASPPSFTVNVAMVTPGNVPVRGEAVLGPVMAGGAITRTVITAVSVKLADAA